MRIKKPILLVVFLIIYLFSFSQGTGAIKTDNLCTDDMAQTAKGRWIKTDDVVFNTSNEVVKRLEEIHKLTLKAYPDPAGVDVAWNRMAGISYFGSKRTYYKNKNGDLTFDYSNVPHFIQYSYSAGFFAYRCDVNQKTTLHPGYPGETGTWFGVIANKILGETGTDDTWTINGLPVIMKKPALKVEDGIEFLYPEPGRNVRHVLVYRKGTLPYTSVTRKQYLEYCIAYHTKMFDDIIKGFEQMPVRSLEEQENEKNTKLVRLEKQFANDPKKLKANVDYYLSGYKTDQQIRADRVQSAKLNKEMELKKFTDELDKTTREGLLNSPAMVLLKYYSTPVFETDPGKGLMLIIENPDYIRKELPKHVPQLFEVFWVWDDQAAQAKVATAIEKYFLFDRLRAMIDK